MKGELGSVKHCGPESSVLMRELFGWNSFTALLF